MRVAIEHCTELESPLAVGMATDKIAKSQPGESCEEDVDCGVSHSKRSSDVHKLSEQLFLQVHWKHTALGGLCKRVGNSLTLKTYPNICFLGGVWRACCRAVLGCIWEMFGVDFGCIFARLLRE